MNRIKKTISKEGFTLVELLISISIIAMLLLVVSVSLKGAKDKARDVEVKKTISELAVKVESKEIAPGVIDYTKAFSSVGADATISELATKMGVGTTGYSYEVTPTNYVVAFPLKIGTYWCIDNVNQGGGVEVPSLIKPSGPRQCSNTLAVDGGGEGGGGGGVSSARTLSIHSPFTVNSQNGSYGVYFYESLPPGYNEDTSKQWPLLIYIHGGHEATNPIETILNNGPLKHVNLPENNQMQFVVNGENKSFIILAPHNHGQFVDVIDSMIEYAKSNYRVDTSRIYLTGVSSGSVRIADYVSASDTYIQKIAAIAPVDSSNELFSGYPLASNYYGVLIDTCRINRNNLPIWVHRSSGHAPAPSWIDAFLDALRSCTPVLSPVLSYSYYNNQDGAWNEAYDPTHNSHPYPNLYEWLLLNSKGGTPPAPPFPYNPFLFGGIPGAIPGIIQAENYNTGGPGVSYIDSTSWNIGGAFRGDQVDIENTGDFGGGYNIGWATDGEWLEYGVMVNTTKIYTFETRAASVNSGKSLELYIDGNLVTTVSIPNTVGWQTYQSTSTPGISLTAGPHTIKIRFVTGSSNDPNYGFNLNYIKFI